MSQKKTQDAAVPVLEALQAIREALEPTTGMTCVKNHGDVTVGTMELELNVMFERNPDGRICFRLATAEDPTPHKLRVGLKPDRWR